MRPAALKSLFILACCLQVAEMPAMEASAGAWALQDKSSFSPGSPKAVSVRPDLRRYQAARLDLARFDRQLNQAPAADGSRIIRLPNPDGEMESFRLFPATDMHPDLQRWFAGQGWPMRSFRGVGIDKAGQTIRLDWGGPGGLHASVDGTGRTWYVDPVARGDRENYASYDRNAFAPVDRTWGCSAIHLPKTTKPGLTESTAIQSANLSSSTGGMLRTFRLAVAATGEYTQFHRGVVEAQAAIVTTMTRVNQIYERDLSIHMTLVGNNQLLVYDDPDTDPYSNNNAGAMIAQNQDTLDDIIGNANYDIGHVFSTYPGGLAYVGAGCINDRKAGGVTGRSSPVGETFDVDFVAHEMGHQWGAEHTFNSELGSCSGDNRSASSAFEPGSGSTILAYAGICANDNLQLNSDAYFHARSLDQMLDYSALVTPSCGTLEAVNANPPQVDAGGDHVIPAGTPFELTAVPLSGEESGESFTYAWEQWDLGDPSALSEGDTGEGPLIRSVDPVASAVRSIPSLAELQTNTLSTGVTLPQTTRALNFRVTIRDNHPSGGRVGEDFMTVSSVDTGAPFELTFPNGGDVLEGEQTITWDVAGTTGNGINAAQVDILLSADDGLTWPYTLAAATPNDGSETVTLPQIVTTEARVRIQPVNNIFFDMSDQAFSIGVVQQCTSPDLPITEGSAQSSLTIADDRSIRDVRVYVLAEHTWVGDVSLSLEHVETGTSVTLLDRPGVPASTYGCSYNDIGVLFADEAAMPAEDACDSSPPAIAGTKLPAEPLSAFAAETLQGQWRLSVSDAVGEDDGTLLQWCLTAQGFTESEIDVQPPLLDFGYIQPGEGPSEPLSVQVESTGLTVLEISEVTITGTDAGLFQITSDSGEALLNPGQARTLEIRFDPDSTGAKTAVLQIGSDDADEAVTDITLQGVGSTETSVIFSDSFELE